MVRPLLVLLLVGTLLATGCGSGEDNSAALPPETTTSTTGPRVDDATRELAPPIAGTSLEGERLALADFGGRPVLVNVWSSW